MAPKKHVDRAHHQVIRGKYNEFDDNQAHYASGWNMEDAVRSLEDVNEIGRRYATLPDGEEKKSALTELCQCYHPVFVMENVPQLLGSFEHGEILGTAEALGFKVHSEQLLAADYGVPQLRHRAFIVGCKHSDPKEVFPPR